MLSTPEITWLAGIVDGEGCLSMSTAGSPTITVQMSDEDVVQRVAHLWKSKISIDKKEGYKPGYRTRVYGAHAIGWMMTLFTWLGQRRRAKIKEIVTVWKANPRQKVVLNGKCLKHPVGIVVRRRSGQRVCRTCVNNYARERRASVRS